MSTGPAEFEALVNSRKSVRRFSDAPLELELVDRLLSTACQAPSAHNRQPWRFAVLSDFATRDKLASAMGENLRADRLADGDDPHEIELDVERSWNRITGAPVAILVCLTREDLDEYPDRDRQDAEVRMAVQGVAMAGGNLLLAAHAHGLGACWMCAPLFAQALVVDALDLPTSWEPQGLVLLGWPAGMGKVRNRRPLEEVAVYL
ncbi:MAG: nitroreductase family protein [Chloroflexi bacterium]|nr:nitroreductase family protein [Chloroflexota bacterium]MCH8877379.1 nitroreductase family protein [Chloroflexota bacterium]MCI0773609.1 nitroreductase family protein [Chloroflexota bacterium]MCI0806926.1 nitroreductase family protein [Chloroflexota bacterium]MCI0827040.1 nitroreductase family protein [Chloroflexota bacterium]